jgi:soluble lytic murein transglycosylase-like protein
MQLKPATAWEVGVKDPFDPHQNIAGGTRYLSYLLRRYKGNISLALGAYKDGLSVVDRHRGLPPEEGTRKYVRRIMTMAEQLSAD